jgi:tetratricopeptide (TPR) repeat protein
LLVEALHEETRWSDELPFFEHIDLQELTADDRLIAKALSIQARFGLGLTARWEVELLLAGVEADLRACTSLRAASWLARTATFIVADERSVGWAKRLVPVVSALETGSGDDSDRIRFAASLAQLHYYAGDSRTALRILEGARHRIDEAAFPSSSSASLLVGIGALMSARGAYAEAVVYNQQAYKMAERLGNLELINMAAANTALGLGRTGQREAQLEWALRAVGAEDYGRNIYNRVLSYYCLAEAAIALGRHALAEDAAERMIVRSEKAAQWVNQAANLFAAEVNERLGRRKEATRHGREATDGTNFELHCGQFAGLFAKWLVNVSSRATRSRDQMRVAALVETLERWDEADRAMVKAAALALGAMT